MESIVLRITREDIRKAYREAGDNSICTTCAVTQAARRHFKKNATSNYDEIRVYDDEQKDVTYYTMKRRKCKFYSFEVAPTAVFDKLSERMGADATFREMRDMGMTEVILTTGRAY